MIHETLYGLYGQPNEGPAKSQFYQFYAVNVFNTFFVIYLPVINASMEESINVIERNEALNSLYLPCTVHGQLFQALYTCTTCLS